MPGGQHEPQRRRGTHHQQLQLPPRLVRAKLVQVVDHQPQPVLERRQILQQPLGDHPSVKIRGRSQLPHQRRPHRSLSQRAQRRQPEPLRIRLVPPQRHPRRPLGQARFTDPGPQQHCLAAAAGADTTVTRADVPSRSNRPRRETTPPAPGPATRRAADPELPAGRIAHDRTNVIHPVRAVQGRSGRSTAAAKGRPLPYA